MHKSLTAFLRSRKGVEIAASTMVILIISIVIFGYSMYFLFEMWKGVQEQSDVIDVQTKAQIDSLLKDPRAKIAIPRTSQEVYSGEMASFAVGVKNVGDRPAKFTINTEFTDAFSYDGKTNLNANHAKVQKWLGTFETVDIDTEDILPKQQKETFILIKPDTQQQGVYLFGMIIKRDGTEYGKAQVSVRVK